jgi:hypothetical protein
MLCKRQAVADDEQPFGVSIAKDDSGREIRPGVEEGGAWRRLNCGV